MPKILKMMDDKQRSIIVTCLKAGGISIIIIVLLIVIIPKSDRSLVNILGILGTVFSLAGVIIAIIQIRKVHAVSEAAENAANEAKYDLKKVLTITEFAQVVALIRKVKQFVRDEKYELAIERISDIKDFLDKVEFLCSPQVDSSTLRRFKIKCHETMRGNFSLPPFFYLCGLCLLILFIGLSGSFAKQAHVGIPCNGFQGIFGANSVLG